MFRSVTLPNWWPRNGLTSEEKTSKAVFLKQVRKDFDNLTKTATKCYGLENAIEIEIKNGEYLD